MKRYTVGVFDSGIGGLTVLAECVRRLPGCDYLYYGDNAHAPYGSRSAEEITHLVRAALRVFSAYGVDAAVLACNTATAVCAQLMRKEFPFPVVGTEPAVKPAAERCSRALVLATPRTIGSDRLRSLVKRFPWCAFTLFAPPDLAGAVERAEGRAEKVKLEDHLPRGNYDGVVLGCTHYVYLRREISAFYGAPVFDGNRGTAQRLASLLSDGGERGFAGTADHKSGKTGTADHCGAKIGTADHKSGETGTADHFGEKRELFDKNGKNSAKTGAKTSIFYLGSGKTVNKRIYEQMFAT